MKRLDVYKLALSLMDMTIDGTDDDTKERRLLDLNLGPAVSFCLKAWDFPSLVRMAKLTGRKTDDDGKPSSWHGFRYGYALPDGFGSAVEIGGDRKTAYSVRFGSLWCNVPEPTLEYMPDSLETDEDGGYDAPDDFMTLVAYQLALRTAPTLDPDGKSMSTAAQLYQLTLSGIMENETRSNDRPENYGAAHGWDDDPPSLTQSELRDLVAGGGA